MEPIFWSVTAIVFVCLLIALGEGVKKRELEWGLVVGFLFFLLLSIATPLIWKKDGSPSWREPQAGTYKLGFVYVTPTHVSVGIEEYSLEPSSREPSSREYLKFYQFPRDYFPEELTPQSRRLEIKETADKRVKKYFLH